MHEGDHAKDFSERRFPWLYRIAYILPFVALYHEGRTSNDTILHLHSDGTVSDEQDA